MHKKDLGNLGEFVVITQCLRNGLKVFKDVGDNSKIDLIICDKDMNLFKVQVKNYQREKNGSTVVYFHKSGPNYRFRYSETEVDYFAVVDQDTDKIAWVKYADYSTMRCINLTHVEPRNCQKSRARKFSDYELFPFNS